jgi:hypothetical protein
MEKLTKQQKAVRYENLKREYLMNDVRLDRAKGIIKNIDNLLGYKPDDDSVYLETHSIAPWTGALQRAKAEIQSAVEFLSRENRSGILNEMSKR